MPFSFEFDPILAVEALLTLPDLRPGEAAFEKLHPPGIARGRRGDRQEAPRTSTPSLVLRRPARPDRVSTPLPCDLAHRLAIEFEGVPGQFRAGQVIVSGQGSGASGTFRDRRFLIPGGRSSASPPTRSIVPASGGSERS